MGGEPLFETGRLTLRRLVLADSAALFAYRCLPEVARFQGWRPGSPAEAEAFARRNEVVNPGEQDSWLQLAICLKDGPMVGDLGLHFLEDTHQAELGFTIAPQHQRRGYAAEAAAGALGYLFGKLDKHRVIASADPRNSPSLGLLLKLGFRKEAHFVQSFWDGEAWADDCIFAMLQSEWRDRPRELL